MHLADIVAQDALFGVDFLEVEMLGFGAAVGIPFDPEPLEESDGFLGELGEGVGLGEVRGQDGHFDGDLLEIWEGFFSDMVRS